MVVRSSLLLLKLDRKSTRLNSSHVRTSYAVFCLKKKKAGRLHRNFMGYTTLKDVPLVGLGMSAISELPGIYAKVRAKLPHFYAAVERGEPMIEKALLLFF